MSTSKRDEYIGFVMATVTFGLALVTLCVMGTYVDVRHDCHERCNGSFALHVGLTSQSCRCAQQALGGER